MDSLGSHVKYKLAEYIRKELDHGYSLDAIKAVLVNYHHHNIVDEAIGMLSDHNFKVHPAKSKKLDKEMFYQVVVLLQEYIQKQRRRGYTPKQIKEAMLRFGHADIAVQAAIDAVEHGKEPKFPEPGFSYEKVRPVLFPLGVMAFIAALFYVSVSAQESPVRIFAAFAPIASTMLLLVGLYPMAKNKQALLATPILLSVIVYVVMLSGQGIFAGMEAEKLAGLNFIASFFYTLLYIGTPPEVEITRKQEEKELHKIIQEETHGHADNQSPHQDSKHTKKTAEEVEKEIEENLHKHVPVHRTSLLERKDPIHKLQHDKEHAKHDSHGHH